MAASGDGREPHPRGLGPAAAPAGDCARIVLSTSTRRRRHLVRLRRPVDTARWTDDVGGNFDRGHQFMPALTFARGG